MKKMIKRTISLMIAVSILVALPVFVSAEVVKEFASANATTGEMTWMGEDFESYAVDTVLEAGTNNGLYSSLKLKYAGDNSNKYLLVDQRKTAAEGYGALFFAPNATDKITLVPDSKYIYNIDFMVTDLNESKWGIANANVRFTPALNFGANSWAGTSARWNFSCYEDPKGIRNDANATDFGIDKFATNKWSNLKIVFEATAGTTADKVNLTATAYVNGVRETSQTSTLSDVANVISSFGLTNVNMLSYDHGYTLALDNMYFSVYDEDLMESYEAVREYDANGNYTYIGDDFENHTPGVFGVSNTNLVGQDDYYTSGETRIAKDESGNKYLTTNHQTDFGTILIKPESGASFALAKGKKFLYSADFRTEPTDWDFVYTGTTISPQLGYTTDLAKHAIWTIGVQGVFGADATVKATDSTAYVAKATQFGTQEEFKGFLNMNGGWNNVQVIIEVIDADTAAGTYDISTKMLVNGVMMGTEDMSAPAEVIVEDVKGLYSFGIKFKQTSATDRVIHFDNFFVTEYDEDLVKTADKNLSVSSAALVNENGTASINLKPVTQKNQEVFEAIVAAYDEDGKMLDARVEKVTVDGFNFETVNKASLTLPTGTKEIKGFVWRDLKGLVPLTMIEPVIQ